MDVSIITAVPPALVIQNSQFPLPAAIPFFLCNSLMQPPEITFIKDAFTRNAGISIHVLRLDQLHPLTGGNKWFKLKLIIEKHNHLQHNEKPVLISFGGNFSNLIAALAQAGHEHGFKTIGIIRGERKENITLKRAENQGMKLYFVSRSLFADKQTALESVLKQLPADLKTIVIPQGSADMNGFFGCKEILKYVPSDYDYIICSSATGTTLAGLAAASDAACIGIAVLKNKAEQLSNIRHFFLNDGIAKDIPLILEDFHEGGMAKTSQRLNDFLSWFSAEHPGIPIEPVYTGKMMLGIYELLKAGYFKSGSRILCIHTGGLQYLNH